MTIRKFKEIQNAHFTLVGQYVEVLRKTSTLPFFVDIYSLRKVKLKKLSFGATVYRIITSPIKYLFRFLVWKPVVSIFVDSHIHSKLKEISRMYIQILQTISLDSNSSKTQAKWLIQSIENCELFASSLSRKRIEDWTTRILNIVISLIPSIIGLKSFQMRIEAIQENDINSLLALLASTVLFFLIYGFFVYLAISFSFTVKRVLFFPNVDIKFKKIYRILPSKNIYKFENNLFKLIKTNKQIEFPIDIFTLFVTSCILPIIAILFILISSLSKFPNLSIWSFLISFIILAIIPIGIGISYIYEWKKREWR